MKKIGIMTFHASHNNGSMLQALALQTLLEKKYNCLVEIVDFSNEAQQNMYLPSPKATNFRRLIKKIIWATNYYQIKKQYDTYNAFSQQYFNLSNNKYSTVEEMKGIESQYSAFITGSDQVWNIACTDADDAYYLNFVQNTPRYAYAVSFGANNPFELDQGSNLHASYFEKFNKVSVREKNAQIWIAEATDKIVPICLDPTMLYDKEEWEQIVDIGTEPIIPGKYIFYYCFSITEEVQRFLKWVSNKTNMPVYFMEAKEWTLKSCWRNNIKLIKEYGPDVYMNAVKYSEIFLTTSFHGTAFGTIYHKNFWYIKSKDSENSKDDRAVSFLTQLNLTTRYKTISELMELDLYQTTDFSNVDKRLAKLRNDSCSYIESIIQEIK